MKMNISHRSITQRSKFCLFGTFCCPRIPVSFLFAISAQTHTRKIQYTSHSILLCLLINRTESRIDCFVINTSPIRSDIEFISRKYWEVLTYSLRSSILNDLNVLQDFLNTSTQVLQAVTIVDEQYIDESALKYERITNELPAVIFNFSLPASAQNSIYRCSLYFVYRTTILLSIRHFNSIRFM